MHTNESSRMTSNFSNTSRVKHKIIFLGDQHVGKTCVIERFMYDVFDEKPHPTVGVDFLAKTMHVDDKSIRLQLWDTAGQERFRSLIPSYLRDATCAVIVFDVTTREVQFADLEKKAKEYNMKCFEISAKTGENVTTMFKDMAISLQPVENSILSPGNDNQNKQDFQFAAQNKQVGSGNNAPGTGTGTGSSSAKANQPQQAANQNFTLKNDKTVQNGQNQQEGQGKCC